MDVLKFLSELDAVTIVSSDRIKLKKCRTLVSNLITRTSLLRDECINSVEYSDWPELQECVDNVDAILDALTASTEASADQSPQVVNDSLPLVNQQTGD